MKYIIPAFTCMLLLAACKKSKEDQLVGTWQAVKLENEQLEQSIKEKKVFIDTVGTHTTPEMNVQLYGTDNIDSIRKFMDGMIEESRLMQEYTINNTVFIFRKDKIAQVNFGAQPDSANWYFDDDGALVLDDMKLKGAGDKTKMDIIELNDSLLKLRYTESGVTSTATFQRQKN